MHCLLYGVLFLCNTFLMTMEIEVFEHNTSVIEKDFAFFSYLPIEIRNHIYMYMCLNNDRSAKDEQVRGIKAQMTVTYLLHPSGTMYLENGGLYAKEAPHESKKIYHIANAHEISKSLSIMPLYLPHQEVVWCNFSENKKHMAYLVADANLGLGFFMPLHISIVDMIMKTEKKITIAEFNSYAPDTYQLQYYSTLDGYEAYWKQNIIYVENNQETVAALIKQGYSREEKKEYVLDKLINELIGFAVSNNGKYLAVADLTGIMLIEEINDGTYVLKKILEKPLKQSSYCALCFDKTDTVLNYAVNNEPPQCLDLLLGIDKLERYFYKIGACKMLPYACAEK